MSTDCADGTGTGPATFKLDDILEAGAFPSFNLAYHGRDQRRLKERFAALYEPYFRDQPPPTGRGNPSRPRIGILVTRRHKGMFLQSMRGIIEQLDNDRFEPVILCSRAIVETLRTTIRREGLRFVPFGDSLREAVEQVRGGGLRPDLLLGGRQRRHELLPALRPAGPRAMHRLGDDDQRRAGGRLVLFQRTGRIARFGRSQYTERLWRSRTLFRYQDRLPRLRPRRAANSACPRAAICTSAFRTR